MDDVCEFSYMDTLPHHALLNILRYIVDIADKLNVRLVCKRWKFISSLPTANTHLRCTGQPFVTNEFLLKFTLSLRDSMRTLDLNYCHWLRPCFLQGFTKLKALHVIGLQLTNDELCLLISKMPELTRLSFSVSNVTELQNVFRKSPEMRHSFRNLRYINLHIPNSIYNDYVPLENILDSKPFLSWCENLEEIHIVSTSQYVQGIPVSSTVLMKYQRVLSYFSSSLENPAKIKAMTLTGEGQLCTDIFNTLLKTVLESGATLTTLIQPSYSPVPRCCLNYNTINMERVTHLDLSGYAVSFPNPVLNFHSAKHLEYLNLSRNWTLDSNSLKHIARSCLLLSRLKLEDCFNVFMASVQDAEPQCNDFSGIELIIENCKLLHSINLRRTLLLPTSNGECPLNKLLTILRLNKTLEKLSQPFGCVSCQEKTLFSHGYIDTELNNNN